MQQKYGESVTEKDQKKYDKYSKKYSEENFWKKVRRHALKAGKEIIFVALKLYYVLQRPEIPAWTKTIIIGALGYFISPIDAIFDFTPVIGYSDDIGVLVAALATVTAYIDEGVVKLAEEKLKSWFG
ncbi:MAG: hypothetical protein A2381_19875 [Bdellovibrionales bacterium RIFOXYB1_FULL_37_110]|nr:MAG: hypothetical protein A2181_03510 [Bdellovibrionales bacterium RIFOXYA1_FULL_38_20]OFZ50997.1 MAG: hypothetical protein A2417_19660 [Bdellovibrionales bacterium RIFOXYC1_FULL_37_79]OFZ60209.1 MAG: hypothetical protein A2381_19875 [Bdellovibrionales bacterium RIFOXYB1_FULL_37_110]OFZ61571.1 MAG: hypothetical protein A2577_10315 [Bdellovibrionales bacterium RIFOXYD1_FULL_36_51]